MKKRLRIPRSNAGEWKETTPAPMLVNVDPAKPGADTTVETKFVDGSMTAIQELDEARESIAAAWAGSTTTRAVENMRASIAAMGRRAVAGNTPWHVQEPRTAMQAMESEMYPVIREETRLHDVRVTYETDRDIMTMTTRVFQRIEVSGAGDMLELLELAVARIRADTGRYR